MLNNANEIRDISIWAAELSHKYNKSIYYIVDKFMKVHQETGSVEDAKKIAELDLYRVSRGDDGR